MRNIHRLIAMASGLTLTLSVTAAFAQTTKSIAYIKGYTGDEYYTSQECGVLEAAAALGVTATINGAAEWDAAKQTTVLQAVIQTAPGVIIIDATDSRAMIAPVQAAVDAGIAVMTVGDDIEAELPFTFLAADQFRGGEMAAAKIIELLPKGGKVLVVGVKPGISSSDQRQLGFESAMGKNPAFEYLGVQYTDNDQNKAAAVVNATLQAHPDLKAIFAVNLITAQGAAAALRQAGAAGSVELIGFDASPTLINALRDGTIDALISQNPRQLGAYAVADAHAYLKGKRDFERRRLTEPFLLTPENVDTPEGKTAQYVAACN